MGNMEPTLNFDSRFISDCVESYVTLETVGGQGFFFIRKYM